MTEEQMLKLRIGSLIRHKSSSKAVVVAAHFGARLTAIRVYDVTNPSEWDVVDIDKEELQ